MGFEERCQTRMLRELALVRFHGEVMEDYLAKHNQEGIADQSEQGYALLWVALCGTPEQKAKAYFEQCQFGRLRDPETFTGTWGCI